MGWQELASNMGDKAFLQRREGHVSELLPQILNNLRQYDTDMRAGKAAVGKELRGYQAASDLQTQTDTAATARDRNKSIWDNDPNAARVNAGMPALPGLSVDNTDSTGLRVKTRKIGNTTYELPDTLDDAGLAKIYSDYVSKIQAYNGSQMVQIGQSKAIPVPSFAGFVQEQFPEYSDTLRPGSKGNPMNNGSRTVGRDPYVQSTIDNLKAQNMPDAQIKALLKQSKKYSGVNPADYGLK